MRHWTHPSIVSLLVPSVGQTVGSGYAVRPRPMGNAGDVHVTLWWARLCYWLRDCREGREVLEGPQGWVRFSKDVEAFWRGNDFQWRILQYWEWGMVVLSDRPRVEGPGQIPRVWPGIHPGLCFMVKMAGQSQGRADLEVGPENLMSMGWAWPLSQYIGGVGGGESGCGYPGRQLKFTPSSCLSTGPHTEPDSHCRAYPISLIRKLKG